MSIMTEEGIIVAKAYDILCKQADKEKFNGNYLEFPCTGRYTLLLGKKARIFKHKNTGEMVYINSTEELEDYTGLVDPEDYEEVV